MNGRIMKLGDECSLFIQTESRNLWDEIVLFSAKTLIETYYAEAYRFRVKVRNNSTMIEN